MNLKKTILKSIVFTVVTVVIGISSVLAAETRQRAMR